MKTVYWDMSELSPNSGVFGISSSEAKVLPAGTEIHTEQRKVRELVPQCREMEERAGVFFFWEDQAVPEVPFFTAPHVELFARDRDGNWYGRSAPLEDGVYRIPPEGGTAVQVSESMERFARRLLAGEEVLELCRPAQELRVFPSKDAAAQAVELVPLWELLPEDWKGAEKHGNYGCYGGPDEGTGPAGH